MEENVVEGVFSTDVDLSEAIRKFVAGNVYQFGGAELKFDPAVKVTTDRQRQLILFDPPARARATVGLAFLKTNITTDVPSIRLGLDEIVVVIDGFKDHTVALDWK